MLQKARQQDNTQDMDCKPFEANDGPSNDDTAVEQEKKKETPIPPAKKAKVGKQHSAIKTRTSARLRRTTRRY